MATFSTAERKRRPHGDRKSTEMSLHLKQTFEAAVMTQLYPRSQIDIYVKVNVAQYEADLMFFPFFVALKRIKLLFPNRFCSQMEGTTACA